MVGLDWLVWILLVGCLVVFWWFARAFVG